VRTDPPRRELNLRSLLTGMLLGALLTPCNVYSGLKIGWSFNMSITVLLLAYAFWRPLARLTGAPAWQLHESNIAQTGASAAASIISGGLVAPIPAYLLITGETLAWPAMSAWVFSVSFLGVWVAWFLRPTLIERSGLAFPAGVATAEAMRDLFSEGREAMLRFTALASSLTVAAAMKLTDAFIWTIPRWSPSPKLAKLTFSLDPSLLMLGFGAIIGVRAGLSLLAGALLAWGIAAPLLLDSGVVALGPGDGASGFQPLVEWLIWPGVALMASASIASFAGRFRAMRLAGLALPAARGPLAALAAGALLAVVMQMVLFGVHWVAAVLAVPIAFVLAVVAARVTGETGIPPIGAIGKVSQLSFGVLAPGQAVTNLMTANVAGGAAGQCADLMNDFRAGFEVQASPMRQALAQCCGIAVGSLAGSIVFLTLIHDPASQLLTAEWPAPAVAVWKAVAETLSQGLQSVPGSARLAMAAGVAAGVGLAWLERARPRLARRLPSGVTMGLAFVIPASTSMTLCAGALIAYVLGRLLPRWSRRFLIAVAAGLVAGESLFGVFIALDAL